MNRKKAAPALIEPRIVTIRDQRVILDADLAAMYGVSTKALNQAMKRNRVRFPEDFAFQLSEEDAASLRSQTVTSKDSAPASRGGNRYLPWAFTEHGALMAANILRSERAVQMSVYVVRAFVRQREQASLNTEIFRRLTEIDRKLINHDEAVLALLDLIKTLAMPAPEPKPAPLPPKPPIGFKP